MIATATLKIFTKLKIFVSTVFWHEDCGELPRKETMKNEMFQILIIIIVILLLSVYYFYSLDQIK